MGSTQSTPAAAGAPSAADSASAAGASGEKEKNGELLAKKGGDPLPPVSAFLHANVFEH
jgi:hypothetical protein